MEGGCAVTLSSPKTHLPYNILNPYISSSSSSSHRHNPRIISFLLHRPLSKSQILLPNLRNSRHSLEPLSAIAQVVEPALETSHPSKEVSRKVDKSGRFCSPRAARELALLISYAACLEGCDPVRLFDKRVNAKRYPGYVFDKASLLDYDHMSFGGAPVEAGTQEEAEELMRKNEKESTNEAEVLSAPPKLVYNNFVLRLAREILTAVVDRWNDHVLVIDRIIPPNWKDEPAARILELCILHLAMGEITTVGTRHQIVINEAVDLAKRFCDGCAPRVINGCLRTFVKDYSATQTVQP